MARQPHLVSRLQGFGTTIFSQMSSLAEQTQAINLGQGFPDTDGPVEVVDAVVAALRGGINQYPPLPGTPLLRAAIAEHQQRFWGLSYDPDTEITVTTGATEALAAALLALCEVGDEVVVFDPTYDSYAAGIAMAGATIRPVVLRPETLDAAPQHPSAGRFVFDPDELRAAFNPRTRALLLNTPHNPTGKVFTQTELQLLADLCIEHDVIVIADEVYEHIVFEGEHLPIASLPGMAERTITISSSGKSFSFTGWKIGWACGPTALVAALRTAKQFLTFSTGAPFHNAIATALQLQDTYFQNFIEDLRAKRDLIVEGLTASGFSCYVPEGTYFVTADIGNLRTLSDAPYTDGVAFALDLPIRAGVVAVPSQVFYQRPNDGDRFVRFCFTKKTEVIEAAIDRLTTEFAPSGN